MSSKVDPSAITGHIRPITNIMVIRQNQKSQNLIQNVAITNGKVFGLQKWIKWIDRMKRSYLGEFEEIVLLMVVILEGNAYGVSITHEIITQTERAVRLNQVHAALERLEEKGMIKSQMSEPTSERGGRRKRLFEVTAFGRKALHEIQVLRSTLWNAVPIWFKSNMA